MLLTCVALVKYWETKIGAVSRIEVQQLKKVAERYFVATDNLLSFSNTLYHIISRHKHSRRVDKAPLSKPSSTVRSHRGAATISRLYDAVLCLPLPPGASVAPWGVSEQRQTFRQVAQSQKSGKHHYGDKGSVIVPRPACHNCLFLKHHLIKLLCLNAHFF